MELLLLVEQSKKANRKMIRRGCAYLFIASLNFESLKCKDNIPSYVTLCIITILSVLSSEGVTLQLQEEFWVTSGVDFLTAGEGQGSKGVEGP